MKDLLIVEDNSLIGKNIVDATKKINSIGSYFLATTIKEASSLLDSIDFKLITLDLSLPDGNGLEILKILKEKERNSKVLVFSTNTHLKKVCLKYGAFAFFDKANDFEDLIETLSTLN